MSKLRKVSKLELDLAKWFESPASEEMIKSKAPQGLIAEFDNLIEEDGYNLSLGETLLAWTELQMDEIGSRGEVFRSMEDWIECVFEVNYLINELLT